MPRYSICMTCFNEISGVRAALDSLLPQLDDSYEVVVVDNYSTDGTYEALQEYEKHRGVKVIQKRCSRGKGREFAFEQASGDYIIANLDLDDVFLPVVERIVARYHEIAEGNLIVVFNFAVAPNEEWVQNITIGPRELVSSLGGWRDLNIFEDWDLWSRADQAHRYCWTSLRFAANPSLHPESPRAVIRLRRRYERYRERLRLGMKIFSEGERVGLSQRIAFAGARLYLLRRGVLRGQDPSFEPLDPRLFVDFRTGERGPPMAAPDGR
jgi:glycosyltransferase involved in cell wall biosynthesis